MMANPGVALRSQQSKPAGQVSGTLLQFETVHPIWNVSQKAASKPAHSSLVLQGEPQPVGGLQTPAAQISAGAQSSFTVHSGAEPVVDVVVVSSPPSPAAPLDPVLLVFGPVVPVLVEPPLPAISSQVPLAPIV